MTPTSPSTTSVSKTVPSTPTRVTTTEATSTRPTSSAPSKRSAPQIPAGLTENQRQGAAAALKTYQAYWTLIGDAYAAPTQDWSTQANAVLVAPLAAQLVTAIQARGRLGQRGIGKTVVYPKVSKVTANGGEVTISACVDQRGSDVVGKDGKSVLIPDAKGAFRLHPETATVTRFGEKFLIIKKTVNRDVRCATN